MLLIMKTKVLSSQKIIIVIYNIYYATHYKTLGLNINLLLKGSIHVWITQSNRYPRFSSITKSTVVSFNATFDIIVMKK